MLKAWPKFPNNRITVIRQETHAKSLTYILLNLLIFYIVLYSRVFFLFLISKFIFNLIQHVSGGKGEEFEILSFIILYQVLNYCRSAFIELIYAI